MENHVDLIECQPVLYFSSVSLKNSTHIPFIKSDHSAVCPSIVSLCKIQRCLVMRECHERFNPIFSALFKYTVIKFKSCFIRLLFIPFRENPTPGNGCPIYFKSHLGKHFDVLRISVIKIDSLQF